MSDITVNLWNKRIGLLVFDEKTNSTMFYFDPKYPYDNILISPIIMPYPKIRKDSFGPFYNSMDNFFLGLPPMIADSVPDNYGRNIIKKYLEENGIIKENEGVNPIELLSYIGKRGMGALEFLPEQKRVVSDAPISLEVLSDLSQKVLDSRNEKTISRKELLQLYDVGTSAGGVKPKAVVLWNKKDDAFAFPYLHRDGFIPIIVKFDTRDIERNLIDSGKIEYIYSKMAKNSGIEMTECGVFYDNNGSHFYTVRFDRDEKGNKLHLQTFAGLTGIDPRSLIDYDQVFKTLYTLKLNYQAFEQLYRRMVFNYIAYNDDCHLKNISFIMDKQGLWSLSPAYDITFPYQPVKVFKKEQPISINGKTKNITLEDFNAIAKRFGIKNTNRIHKEIITAISQFRMFSERLKLDQDTTNTIESLFRTHVIKESFREYNKEIG